MSKWPHTAPAPAQQRTQTPLAPWQAPPAVAPVPSNLRSRETPHREQSREADWSVPLRQAFTSAAFWIVGIALLALAGYTAVIGLPLWVAAVLVLLAAFDGLAGAFWFRYLAESAKTLMLREQYRDLDGDGKPDGHDPMYVNDGKSRQLAAELRDKRKAADWRFIEACYKFGPSVRALQGAGYRDADATRLKALYSDPNIGILRRIEKTGEYVLPHSIEDARRIFDLLVF